MTLILYMLPHFDVKDVLIKKKIGTIHYVCQGKPVQVTMPLLLPYQNIYPDSNLSRNKLQLVFKIRYLTLNLNLIIAKFIIIGLNYGSYNLEVNEFLFSKLPNT